jgi:hypothetical protein
LNIRTVGKVRKWDGKEEIRKGYLRRKKGEEDAKGRHEIMKGRREGTLERKA